MSKRKSTGDICPKERKMRKKEEKQKNRRLSAIDLLHSPGALILIDDYDKYMKINKRVITFERGSKKMKSKQSGNEELHKRVSREKLKYDTFGNERKKKSNLIKEIIHDFVKQDYKFLVFLRHGVEKYYECNMSDLKSFRCIKEKISQMFREIKCQEKSALDDDDYQFELQLETLEDIESSILPPIQPLGLCTPDDSDPIPKLHRTPASQGEESMLSKTIELSLLEQSNVDSVQVDLQDSCRTTQEQNDKLDENDEDFLRNALGLESNIIQCPTDEELEQFINIDSSEDINLNSDNICKCLPDSSGADESPISVDNLLLSSFESECYAAVCSMLTNETLSDVQGTDKNMHHTECSEMNSFIEFGYSDEGQFYKQI